MHGGGQPSLSMADKQCVKVCLWEERVAHRSWSERDHRCRWTPDFSSMYPNFILRSVKTICGWGMNWMQGWHQGDLFTSQTPATMVIWSKNTDSCSNISITREKYLRPLMDSLLLDTSLSTFGQCKMWLLCRAYTAKIKNSFLART